MWHPVLHWETHSESRPLWEQPTCIVKSLIAQGTRLCPLLPRPPASGGGTGSSILLLALALETHRSKEREPSQEACSGKTHPQLSGDPQRFPPHPQTPITPRRIPQPQPHRKHLRRAAAGAPLRSPRLPALRDGAAGRGAPPAERQPKWRGAAGGPPPGPAGKRPETPRKKAGGHFS